MYDSYLNSISTYLQDYVNVVPDSIKELQLKYSAFLDQLNNHV